jgi:rod shape-determining protein MreC
MKRKSFSWIPVLSITLVVVLVALGLWRFSSQGYPNYVLDIKTGVVSFLVNTAQNSKNHFAKVHQITKLEQENAQLKEQLSTQTTLLNRTGDIQLENTRLKEFLNFVAPRKEAWIAAEVVAHPVDLWTEQLVINKGKLHGIRYNAAVINERGLVGMVIQVGQSSAVVRLITHPSMKVSVINGDTSEVALMEGASAKILRLNYVDQKSQVQAEQKYFTSGQSELFPKSIYVGELIKLENDPHLLFQNLRLKPGVDIDRLDYVLIQR